ncbi:hypothetical protein NP233_g11669 [Leucocoprinus birnbaumii]|uniref:Uncharacterized protein n=1 Tax=Leucocoprinus birnbaumii TaxID=56174 RepID=A0AAD5VFY8_9AGAR|nr:hypothetical protein NP233_g11669 [Leucocoprinus birnbaumii]
MGITPYIVSTSPAVSPKASPVLSPDTSRSCMHSSGRVASAAALEEWAKSRSRESIGLQGLLVASSASRRSGEFATPPQSGASTPQEQAFPTLTHLAFPTMRNSSVNFYMVTPVSPTTEAALDTSLTSVSSMLSTMRSHSMSPITSSSPKGLPSPKIN